MNDDISIQLYLRNMLLDILDEIAPNNVWEYDPIGGVPYSVDVKFVAENTQENYNTKGIIIEENYSDTLQEGYTDYTYGNSYYYLDLSDDRGTGLRLKRFAKLLQSKFSFGVYDVNNNTSFCINDIKSLEYRTEANDKKVHFVLGISISKFN